MGLYITGFEDICVVDNAKHFSKIDCTNLEFYQQSIWILSILYDYIVVPLSFSHSGRCSDISCIFIRISLLTCEVIPLFMLFTGQVELLLCDVLFKFHAYCFPLLH